jgi:diacylglycerol kinase (ATP)
MDQTSHARSIRQVALILNPHSRNAEKMMQQIQDQLGKCGITIVETLNPNPEEYTAGIVRVAAKVDAFVVAGGDGTLNLAVEGLLITKTPVLVLPLGTANNLARNLKIPTDISEACKVLSHSHVEYVDVGRVNGLPFLNVVGLGLSTAVNRTVNPLAKRRFGVLAYMYSAWKIARRMNPFTVWIQSVGKERKIKALQISICNGRFYGSGMVASEDASISDGVLDLIATQVDRWWKGLKLIPALLKGRHQTRDEILNLKSAGFVLRTRRPMQLDVDGDVKTQTPAIFELLPSKLAVLVPS